MPLPCPAPAWMRTRCPRRVSSSTPTGIRATRDSCGLISLGTPTTQGRCAIARLARGMEFRAYSGPARQGNQYEPATGRIDEQARVRSGILAPLGRRHIVCENSLATIHLLALVR